MHMVHAEFRYTLMLSRHDIHMLWCAKMDDVPSCIRTPKTIL